MDYKLVGKIKEDIFTPISQKEKEYREKNRPPRILEGDEKLRLLRMLVVNMFIEDVDEDAGILIEHLFTGEPIIDPPVNKWSEEELLDELFEEFSNTTDSDNPQPFEQWLIGRIKEAIGENYTKIEGLEKYA